MHIFFTVEDTPKKSRNVLRSFFFLLAIVWIGFGLVIGVGVLVDTPRQIKKDTTFITDQIKPSITFVESFRHKHYRLPTQAEFSAWENNFYGYYAGESNIVHDSLKQGTVRRYIKNGSDEDPNVPPKLIGVD